MSERKIVKNLRKQGFTVLTRRQWGSKHLGLYQWRRVNRKFVGPADHAFAHISVTRATSDPKADARSLEDIGFTRFGSGISYNYALHKPTKTIIVGMPHDAAGTHTVNDKNVAGFHDNLNYWGHAIAFIGMPGDEFDDWCRSAVAGIIRAERESGAMKAGARLYPHSMFAFKDCPCDPYRNSIPTIEELAKKEPEPDVSERLSKLKKSRKKRGLRFPGEVTTRTVNLASVSSGPKRVKEVLDNALKGDPDLVLAVECGDIRVERHVDQTKWEVFQFGSLADVSRAGCALIAKRETVKLSKVELNLGSPAGEGIRPRYLLSARARFHSGTRRRWTFKVVVGHAPPGRAPLGRAKLISAMKGMWGIRGGDLNVSPASMRRLFPGNQLRSAGVLHLVLPWWMPASKAKRFNIGSDHKALEVVLFPRRKK